MKLAIVGRPNVGKSTLFNKIARKKLAITHNTPGLTRDRKEASAHFIDINLTLVDTAGFEDENNISQLAGNKKLAKLMIEQTKLAIQEADCILMLLDGRQGVMPMDYEFAKLLRNIKKGKIIAINKAENHHRLNSPADAYKLGLGEPIYISAEHAIGFDELYHKLKEFSPTTDKTRGVKELREGEEVGEAEEAEIISEEQRAESDSIAEDVGDAYKDDILQIAIIGKPNAGKSTLFNKVLNQNRSITSEQSGTTRDSIFCHTNFEGRQIRLIDTAGIRKKSRVVEAIESFSVKEAIRAIDYANIVILLFDATDPLTVQDLKLADYVVKQGRCLILAANKWDLIEQPDKMREEIEYMAGKYISQARGVPIVTISALEGRNIAKLFRKSFDLYKIWNQRIATAKLNQWLSQVTQEHIPQMVQGQRIRFKFISQINIRPPTFLLSTSSKIDKLDESYKKYLINALRKEFNFDAVPIRLLIRKTNNPYSS